MEKMYLQSERLRLRPLEKQDLPKAKEIFAQAERIKLYLPGTYRFYNEEQLRLLLEDWNDTVSSFVYCIERLEDGAFVGLCNIDDFSYVAKHFDLGIVLAAPSFEGKGYAKETLHLILDYMFNQYNMKRAAAKIMSSNLASQKLFRQLGFKEEGCWRSYVYRDGQYLDLLHFSLLKEEFLNKDKNEK